jgi:hypothetical protein
MNQRTLLGRLLSPAGFGLVLLLFLLPMATVSCSSEGETANASFTGLDIVIGGEPTITGTNLDPDGGAELSALFIDFYDAEPLAIIAVVLLLVGMAAALIRRRQLRATVTAAIAAVALVLLALVVFVRAPAKVNAAMDWFRIEAQADQPLNTSISPTVFFWVAAAVLLALAAWQGYEAVRAKEPDPEDLGDPPRPTAGPTAIDPGEVPVDAHESWRAPEAS